MPARLLDRDYFLYLKYYAFLVGKLLMNGNILQS